MDRSNKFRFGAFNTNRNVLLAPTMDAFERELAECICRITENEIHVFRDLLSQGLFLVVFHRTCIAFEVVL